MTVVDRIRALLPRSPFWRQLALVAGGAALGQAATIVASPFLSRLYGPDEFGVLAVYTSITGILAVGASLCFHLGIPPAETDEEASRLLLLALLTAFAVSALVAVGVLLVSPMLDRLVPVPGFGPFVWLVPLGVLGLGTYEALSQWATRQKAFGVIGKTSASRSVVQVGTQLAAGGAKLGATGLVLGQLLGQWSGTLQLARLAWCQTGEPLRKTTLRDLTQAARKNRRYPLFSTPGALLSALDAHSAPLLFAHFFGAAVTGQFALGQRLLAIPFFLVASSTQKVFAPAAAEAQRAGRLAIETEQTYRRLLALMFPMVFLLVVCAPELFSVVLGAQWHEAGEFMQWMSLRTCFTLLVFPLMPLLNVLEKQSIGMAFSGAQFVVRAGSIYVGSRLADPHWAVALLGTCTGAMWLGYLAYLLAVSGVSLARAGGLFIKESLLPALVVSPVLVVKALGASALAVTLTAGFAGALALVVVVRRLRSERVASPVIPS